MNLWLHNKRKSLDVKVDSCREGVMFPRHKYCGYIDSNNACNWNKKGKLKLATEELCSVPHLKHTHKMDYPNKISFSSLKILDEVCRRKLTAWRKSIWWTWRRFQSSLLRISLSMRRISDTLQPHWLSAAKIWVLGTTCSKNFKHETTSEPKLQNI